DRCGRWGRSWYSGGLCHRQKGCLLSGGNKAHLQHDKRGIRVVLGERDESVRGNRKQEPTDSFVRSLGFSLEVALVPAKLKPELRTRANNRRLSRRQIEMTEADNDRQSTHRGRFVDRSRRPRFRSGAV